MLAGSSRASAACRAIASPRSPQFRAPPTGYGTPTRTAPSKRSRFQPAARYSTSAEHSIPSAGSLAITSPGSAGRPALRTHGTRTRAMTSKPSPTPAGRSTPEACSPRWPGSRAAASPRSKTIRGCPPTGTRIPTGRSTPWRFSERTPARPSTLAGRVSPISAGCPATNIAALDAVTSLATNWNPNAFGAGADTSVNALAISDSTVYRRRAIRERRRIRAQRSGRAQCRHRRRHCLEPEPGRIAGNPLRPGGRRLDRLRGRLVQTAWPTEAVRTSPCLIRFRGRPRWGPSRTT